ncbi:MAG: hypothetical protein ACRBFS_22640 [Aureispira sp.]
MPERIAQLQQRQLLHLKGGIVQNFPLAALQQLPWLESLSFTTCQQVNVAALWEALPHCRLNVRGSFFFLGGGGIGYGVSYSDKNR